MFSSFLNTGQGQSRSKSPSARRSRESTDHSTTDDERSYRRSSRGRYPESDSDDNNNAPETPRYVERTPDYYGAPPSKDDRRHSRREDDYGSGRTSTSKYAYPEVEDARTSGGRRERDQYLEDAETPRSARPNGNPYVNGDSARYAAFAGSGSIPGGFPGQSVKPVGVSPQPYQQQGPYANVGNVQYQNVDPSNIQYNYNTGGRQPSYSKAYDTVAAQPPKPSKPSISAQQKAYQDDRYARKESARPYQGRENSDERIKSVAEAGRRQSYHRERSPAPSPRGSAGVSVEQLRQNLGRLSTSGGATLGVGQTPATAGGRPPASPLLEAYKGTYQTISPLPSPQALALRRRDDDDLSDLELSSSDGSGDDHLKKQIRALEREKQRLSGHSSGTKLDAPKTKQRTSSTVSNTSTALSIRSKTKKAVSFYDPDSDAKKLAEALKGNHRTPDTKPLLKILPWLTADEITALKIAYKNHAKINGQGINLSKHIKARIPGNLGKLLYATSLGQYESDAYWANCFYQSGASRRELLIESLVGRTNQQIREIKDVFKDKRYDDDLEKCMKAELKADKFRFAILMALEERRMPEGLGINMKLVHEDGLDLHDALRSAGGETDMIKIVMHRSDDHLREVLNYYEKSYRRNFARDMISKSQNLVVSCALTPSNRPYANRLQGETLAHILNGALNKPLRDAILMHQAIDEFAPQDRIQSPNAAKPPSGRAELLISRVVRLHWDAKHLERVKREYEHRYKESLARAIARDVQGGMKTDDGKAWSGFCVDLVRSSEA